MRGSVGQTAEDCLYPTSFAPADAKSAPVMVWLHGGASYLGGAHLGGYNGEAFAKNGVLIVTVNYRLGPLGYFSHPALRKEPSRTNGSAAMASWTRWRHCNGFNATSHSSAAIQRVTGSVNLRAAAW